MLESANDTFHATSNGDCVGSILTNPGLGVLQNNGGINRTMAPASPGPAVNAATGTCPPPATDQRDFTRPAGGACDLGALEVGATLVDTMSPACSVVAVVSGNPKAMDVRALDTGRGLAAISNPTVTNGTIVVPFFLPGTTQPVVLAAVKTNQAQATVWSFTAVDAASPANTKLCT